MKYFCRLKLHPISFVCAERAFYGWSSPIFLHKWANCISISKIWGSSRAECAYISNDCREQTKDIHYLAHTAIWCNLQTRIDSLPQPARLECRTEQSEFHSSRLEPIFHVLLKGLINLRSETEQSELEHAVSCHWAANNSPLLSMHWGLFLSPLFPPFDRSPIWRLSLWYMVFLLWIFDGGEGWFPAPPPTVSCIRVIFHL